MQPIEQLQQALAQEKAARLQTEFYLSERTQQWQTACRELEQVKQTMQCEVEHRVAEMESIALFAVQYPEPLIRINYAGEVVVKNVSATTLDSFVFRNKTYRQGDFWRLLATMVRRQKSEWSLEAFSNDILYSFSCRPDLKNEHINIYGKDITRERKSQEEMQRLSLVARANNNGVIFTKPDGKIFWANEGFSKLTGFSNTETMGQTPLDLCKGPLSNEETIRHMVANFFEGKPFCVEVLHYRKDNTPFWGRCSGQPTLDENGQVVQYFTVIEDITSEKEQEEKLRRREEKYRSIIANMRLGMVELNTNGEVCFVNKCYCDMTGYEPSELIGREVSSLIVETSFVERIKDELSNRKRGMSNTYEAAVRNKKGELRWWLISGTPLYNDEGELTGSIGVTLDITEQKILEHQLRESKQEAEQSARTKETFLANMSHEIRTPMNAVLGMSKLLQKTVLTNEQKVYASTIQKAAGNLLVIINDILDFSKIEAGKITLESIGFDIRELTQQNVFAMAHKAEEKGLGISVRVAEEVEDVLLGDPFRLNQILMNLLSNAIKFTNKGSVQLKCGLDRADEETQTLLLQVIDTGVGMDADYQQRLFEKFTQEDGSVARRYGGTGLGMSICKQLVEMMQGTIEVHSQKNIGTTISLRIPLLKGKQNDLPVRETEKINTKLLHNKQILVAEDNELNRLVVYAVLQNYDVQITEAVNGLEAIQMLQKNQFDLVLMDVQMPEMDGLEATRIIRKSVNKTIPIIALTANAIQGEMDKCLQAGMNGYLSKPFEEEDLLQLITKWISREIEFTLPAEENVAEQPLYDLSRLSAISRGNTAFIQKMLGVFVKEVPPTVAGIKEAFQLKDLPKVKALAHRIKPSIDNMGIILLAEDIRRIEKLAAEENREKELEPLIRKLENVMERVIRQIEAA